MASKLFVYDPENPRRDEVLAFLCDYTEKLGQKAEIVVRDPKKSRIQEQKYHAMLTDISRDVRLAGRGQLSAEVWKRMCIEQFKFETQNDPDLAHLWRKFGELKNVLSIDGERAVTLGEQSRDFGVRLASAFIEWLYAFGSENSVQWREVEKLKTRGI